MEVRMVSAAEAKARAAMILDGQKAGQVIKLTPGGDLQAVVEADGYGKRTMLFDDKGEFGRGSSGGFDWSNKYNFERDSPEFRMGRVRDLAHRFQVEREKLDSAFNGLLIDPPWHGTISAIGGAVEPIPGGFIRDFQVVVTRGYPNAEPKAYARGGWTATGPHVYKEGHLCLWHPRDWSPKYTLAYTVAKTYLWIHKHEQYVRSGRWPGNQQQQH
jgi:hypothetical protein